MISTKVLSSLIYDSFHFFFCLTCVLFHLCTVDSAPDWNGPAHIWRNEKNDAPARLRSDTSCLLHTCRLQPPETNQLGSGNSCYIIPCTVQCRQFHWWLLDGVKVGSHEVGRVCSVEHDEVSCFRQILELLGSSGFERSAHDKKMMVGIKHDNSELFTFLYQLCQCIFRYGWHSYTIVSDILPVINDKLKLVYCFLFVYTTF